MARSADNLEAGLRVLAGPEPPDSKAFRWALPKSRRNALRRLRIGYVLDDPAAPVSVETKIGARIGDTRLRTCGRRNQGRLAARFSFPRTARHLLLPLGCGCLSLTPRMGSMCGASSAHGPSSSSKAPSALLLNGNSRTWSGWRTEQCGRCSSSRSTSSCFQRRLLRRSRTTGLTLIIE